MASNQKAFTILQYHLDSVLVIGLRYNMEAAGNVFGDPDSIRSDPDFKKLVQMSRGERPHVLLLNPIGISQDHRQRLLHYTLISISDIFREHFSAVWIQGDDRMQARAAWVAPAMHPTEVVERPVQVGDKRLFSDFEVERQ